MHFQAYFCLKFLLFTITMLSWVRMMPFYWTTINREESKFRLFAINRNFNCSRLFAISNLFLSNFNYSRILEDFFSNSNSINSFETIREKKVIVETLTQSQTCCFPAWCGQRQPILPRRAPASAGTDHLKYKREHT